MRGCTGGTLILLLCLGMGCADTSGQRIGGDMPDPRSGIFVEKCTDCHNLDKVEAAQGVKTKAEMREIVKRHKDMEGSRLTYQDLKALLKMY